MRQQDEVVEEGDARSSGELLRRIGPARRALEEVVGRLTDDVLLRPHPQGGWPVLGHLTHLSAWERMLVAHLADGTDHDVVRMTSDEYTRATLDDLNERIYSLHEREPVDAVRAEFAAAHEALLQCIETLTPEELERPYWPDEERTVAGKFAGDTYLHYEEHRGWILEMVAEAP